MSRTVENSVRVGADGSFSVPFEGGPGLLTVHVSAWSEASGRIEIALEYSDRRRAIAAARVFRHRAFDLSAAGVNSGSVVLRASGGAAFIEEVYLARTPGVRDLPAFDLLGAVLVFLLIAVAFLKERLGARWFIAVAAFVGVASAARWTGPAWPWLAVSAALVAQPNGRGRTKDLLFLAALALAFRWPVLKASVGHSLEGDAIGYAALAQTFTWTAPFATGFREPLYVWTLSLVTTVLGQAALFSRLFTLSISIATVLVAYELARSLSRRRVHAFAAGALMAAGHFAVVNSIRGERSELYFLLILLYGLAVVRLPPRSRNEALLGGLAVAAALTWLVGAVACLLVYAARWALWKVRLRDVGVFLGMFALLVSPLLLAHRAAHGDPLHSINVHTNFYRNARRTGTPSYEGARRSMASFLREEARSLAGGTLKGYAGIFLDPRNPYNRSFLGFHYSTARSLILYPLLLIGIAMSVVKREWWVAALLFGILNVSVAFLPEVRDPRLFLHASFFVAYFFGGGLAAIGDAGRRLILPRIR